MTAIRDGTVTPWDRTKHRPELRGTTWEPLKMNDLTGRPELVLELSAEADAGELPEFLREALEAEGQVTETESEHSPARKPTAGERGLKFRYPKELRGRVGRGPGKLTPTEFAALMMLHSYADPDLSNARPGHVRLAEDLGYSGRHATRTVRELVSSLETKGFLVVTRRGSNGSTPVATTYRLSLPEWD